MIQKYAFGEIFMEIDETFLSYQFLSLFILSLGTLISVETFLILK